MDQELQEALAWEFLRWQIQDYRRQLLELNVLLGFLGTHRRLPDDGRDELFEVGYRVIDIWSLQLDILENYLLEHDRAVVIIENFW